MDRVSDMAPSLTLSDTRSLTPENWRLEGENFPFFSGAILISGRVRLLLVFDCSLKPFKKGVGALKNQTNSQFTRRVSSPRSGSKSSSSNHPQSTHLTQTRSTSAPLWVAKRQSSYHLSVPGDCGCYPGEFFLAENVGSLQIRIALTHRIPRIHVWYIYLHLP